MEDEKVEIEMLCFDGHSCYKVKKFSFWLAFLLEYVNNKPDGNATFVIMLHKNDTICEIYVVP